MSKENLIICPECAGTGKVKAIELDWGWECNKCGFQDWSSAVSEDDLDDLNCSNCGANEYHKVPV